MAFIKRYLPQIILLISIVIGGFFRFYKLDWGNGYYFNPDEYHIVGAVERLIRNGVTSNPGLFSYGSFSVYLIFFTHRFVSFISPKNTIDLFIIGRFLSALFSVLTIVNIYLISKILFNKSKIIPYVIALTSAFVPGLVQQAHFLTPESFMTFWITLSTYSLIRYLQSGKITQLIISALSLGIAGACKVSSSASIPFVIAILFFLQIKKIGITKSLRNVVLFLALVFLSFTTAFPYSIVDYESFKNTTRYESSLSFGNTRVFYTRSFKDTKPILFQLLNVYPYTLGMVLTIFSFTGVILIITNLLKNKDKTDRIFLMPLVIFLSYFLFNSFLFTKWVRFVHQTIPFLVIFSFYGIYKIQQSSENNKNIKIFISSLTATLMILTILWGIMYFSIYKNDDVRTTASRWVNTNISSGSIILTETGNTLEVPLAGNYQKIPFDFYNVDNNPLLYQNLISNIYKSDYFIIQSRRIFYNHNDKKQFPIVYNFYNCLFSGKLGFKEIDTFTSYPKLKIGKFVYTVNDEGAEETWSVFDHPVIRVYKKINIYSLNYYDQLLR
jgi:hypothetical protein